VFASWSGGFLDIHKCLGCSFGLTAEFSVAFLVEQYFVWRAVARFSKQNVPLWEAVEPYLCKGTLISQNYASISGYEDSYFGSTEIIKYLPNMLTELQLPCTVNLNNNHFFVWFLFSDEKVFWYLALLSQNWTPWSDSLFNKLLPSQFSPLAALEIMNVFMSEY
jgi:hypothetical protein